MKKTFVITSLLATSVVFASTDPHWTYDEPWENLSNTTTPTKASDLPYAECGLGLKQSPVDLNALKAVKSTNALKTAYKSESLTVVNNGHSIKVNLPATSKSVLSIGSEQYNLLQYHIHAPSEHVVNGKASAAEIHFVHSTPDGKLAVVGVIVDVSATAKKNVEFQKILDVAPSTLTETPALIADPTKLLSSITKFYLYSGSLTTPPCTEGVNWYVLKTPIQITPAQLTAFEDLYHDNARPVQALNGRQVLAK
jgi:carbonic anhydrase